MRVRVVAVCFSGPSMNRFLSDAAIDVGSPTFESPTWDRAKMALCDLAQVSVLSMAVFSTRTGTGGTGLGLAMVKRLIEASGGSIEVESDPGHGTSMHVDLPIAVDP